MGEPGPKGEQVSDVIDRGNLNLHYQMLHCITLTKSEGSQRVFFFFF